MNKDIWILMQIALITLAVCVAKAHSKKRILIHVPVQVKEHHHTHTVYKHIVHEHDHEHQHHGGEPTDDADSEPHASSEYSSGSNADYKVLGYTYGNDAEPVIRDTSGGGGGDDDDVHFGPSITQSDHSDEAEWGGSYRERERERDRVLDRDRDRERRRQPASSGPPQGQRHRNRYHSDEAGSVEENYVPIVSGHSGSGGSGHRAYVTHGTRARPPSIRGHNAHKGYRSKGGNREPSGYNLEYSEGTHEDERSDEIWNGERK